MIKCRVLISLLFLCFLSSCITTKQTNFLQDIDKNYPEKRAPSDYKIIPGDKLRLTIYTLDPEMEALFSMYIGHGGESYSSGSTTATSDNNGSSVGDDLSTLDVSSDGSINIPYAGKIYVRDLTVLEAKKLIAKRLSDFSSKVTVDIILSNRYFSLIGAAGPGRYRMIKPRMTIFEALATSGLIAPEGNTSKVRIVRQTASGTIVKVFDIRSKDIVNSEFYYIQPNDVIYVEKRKLMFFGKISSFYDIFGVVTTALGFYYLYKTIKK